MKNIAKIFGINLSREETLAKDKNDKITDNKDDIYYKDSQIEFESILENTGSATEQLVSPEDQKKVEGFESYLSDLKKSAGLTESTHKIAISEIVPNPHQPRKIFNQEALAELAASIKEFGVIQPVIVRPIEESGKYELIAGERRLRASREAGLLEVPVIVRNINDKEMAEVAMIENLQREDLNFMEEAEGFLKLIANFGFTQEELAARMGKSQSTIANKLRLLKLTDKVRQVINAEALTERHARALLRLDSENSQLEILETVVQKKLNVRETEELIEKYLGNISREKNKVSTPKQTVMKIVKDVRIYLNTINSVAGQMKKNGMDVNCKQEIDGEYVIVTMKIKNQKK